MQLKVIDIASWQHPNNAPIDWHKVAAAGVQGVIVKATQGTWYTNPFFDADAKDALDAGLIVGAFHFAEPGRGDPSSQATYFHGVIAGHELGLGVWLDLEETGGMSGFDLQQWADAFLGDIDTPQAPAGLYVNISFATMLTGTGQVKRLWLANPSNLPNQYQPYMIQTGQGEIDGIVGAVDLDIIPAARGVNPPGGGANPLPAPAPAPAAAPGTSDQPTLNQGTNGDPVRHLQELLNRHGAQLAVDGDFGPVTHEAVIEFQSTNGLVVDGIVGPITWMALNNPGSRQELVAPTHEPEIAQGATGAAVVLLQRLLNELGDALNVDGDFGPLTREAVARFQSTHGLVADGIVGPITWTSIRNQT